MVTAWGPTKFLKSHCKRCHGTKSCKRCPGTYQLGILFANHAATESALEYVTVEYGGSSSSGIRIYNSSPTIRHSIISNNANAGIYIYRGDAFPEITDSTVSDNATYGVSGQGIGSITIKDSEISRNGIHGIWVRESTSLTVINSTISNNGTHGVYSLSHAGSTITNSTISSNGKNGIYFSSFSSYLTISGTYLTGNGSYAISIYASIKLSTTGITVNGNGMDAIELLGGVGYDTTWKDHTIPYIITDHLSVCGSIDSEPILSIEPGVEVRFDGPYSLRIGLEPPDTYPPLDCKPAILKAQGTALRPILFTSNKVSPAPGDWSTIRFYDRASTASILDHVTVEYAGNGIIIYNNSPTIRNSIIKNNANSGINILRNAAPLITNSEISNNAAHGIYAYMSGNINLTFNTIKDNAGYAIYAAAPVLRVNYCNITGNGNGFHSSRDTDARFNWWGSVSGPSGEGPGTGQSINTSNFEPWLGTVYSYPFHNNDVHATRQEFSPLNNSVKYSFSISENSNWTFLIKDTDGTPIKTFTGSGIEDTVTWDGKPDGSNVPVPDGTYTYQLSSTSLSDRFLSAPLLGDVVIGEGLPKAEITYPVYKQLLDNTVLEVQGTADDSDFVDYIVEYGLGSAPTSWTLITDSRIPVVNGILATWDRSQYFIGPYYTIRLTVNDSLGNTARAPVIINNGFAINNISVSNTYFSPNRDGFKDTTTITAQVTYPVLGWIVEIKSPLGSVVRTLTGTGDTISATWDGRSESGFLQPERGYSFTITATELLSGLSVTEDSTANITIDTTPPDVVNDLAIAKTTFSSVLLAWTAVMDNGPVIGPAGSYDIRYSTEMITDANWYNATQADVEPMPSAQGTEESFLLTSLIPQTAYYFAIKVTDKAGVKSGLSNVIVSTPPADWYDTAWSNRRQITIDSTMTENTDQADFPVLIRITGLENPVFGTAQTSGEDILFTSSDGVTPLDYEIEKYDSVTDELLAWVRMPVLSASVDTVIYMYYGNRNATSSENPKAVWDASYSGVWHLSEDVTDDTTGGTHFDSTSNLNDGTQYNNAGITDLVHNGQDFDGDNDYIVIPDSDPDNQSLKFGTGDFTVSLWAKLDSTGVNQYLINKYPGGGAPGFHLGVVRESLGSVFWVMEHGDTYDDLNMFGTLSVVDSEWHHLLYVRNSVTGLRELWVDGVLDSPVDAIYDVDNIDTTHSMIIGGRYTNPTGAWANGLLDEIRLSNIARSADWIITSYNNQRSPESYIMLGFEEAVPSGTVQVNATLDGVAWSSGRQSRISYALTGPTIQRSRSLPAIFSESSTGTYTLTSISGGPTGAILRDITPLYEQTLDIDGTIIFTLNFISMPTNAGWYDPAWSSRQQMLISSNMTVNPNLSDFPMLIRIKDLENPVFVTALPSGDDIVFTSSDGLIQLYHEIEKYDPVAGELIAWVRIPTLSSFDDTIISMYYGNDSVSYSQERSQEVWGASYSGVWHLSEDVTDETTGETHFDSTSNSNNGTQYNNAGITDLVHTGQDFDGDDDYIVIPDSDNQSLKFGTGDFTVSLWARLDSTGVNQYLINKYPGGGAPGFHLGVVRESLGSVFWVMEHGDTYADFSVFGTLPVVDSQWHHLVYVRNSVTGLRELWVDGQLETSDTETHPVDNIDTTHRMIIGGRYTNPTGAWTNGVLDEIRISRTVRSADWIITSYNNQNDPEGYLKLWPQENTTGMIEVNATVNGAIWNGSIRYTLTGPENIYGDSVPVTLESLTGTYTLAYTSGGPANAILTDISPSDTQTLDADGTISFTLNFLAPPPPSDLTATAISSSQIDLSWTDDSIYETGFKIERKICAGGTYTQIGIRSTNVTTYSDTGLSLQATYCYRIRTYNTAGDSAYSNEASATTLPLPPVAPSALTAVGTSPGVIDLSWTDNAGNETSFSLERKTGLAGTYAEVAVLDSGTTIYSDTLLTPDTTYYYRVRSNNLGGASAYSNEAGATTMPAVAPTATTDLATDINGNSAVLNATVNPNGSETTVYSQWGTSLSYGNTTPEPAQSAGRGTDDVAISAKITGLLLNTTYYYRVVASSSAGTVPGSGRSFTTPPITLTITSPSDGETIYGPDIMVTGTVINATGSETGVSVNGILASMNGNEFFVNHVSLEQGANTITATATDTDGNTASTSIAVQAEAADYVTLKASTESGIDPLTTYFSVTTSIPNAVSSYEMDYDGDGTVDYTGATFDGISFTYTTEGIYYPTVTVIDTAGIAYSDTMVIVVMNEVELDALLRGKWDAMKTALIAGDISGAVEGFVEESQDSYNEVFTAIYDNLPQLVQDMQGIQLIYAENNISKYRIIRNQLYGGQTLTITYYIYFVVDSDGIWRIYKF